MSQVSNGSRSSSSFNPYLKQSIFDSDYEREKEVQAGCGTEYKAPRPWLKKKKLGRRKKKKCGKKAPCLICIDEDSCRQHSFCVVEGLKKQGVDPFYPNGLPWATGLLPYLPGQRPKYFTEMKTTDEDIFRREQAKNKKKKCARSKKKAAMQKLRAGDDRKLCDVISTTQELMMLMKLVSFVSENRRQERLKRIAAAQTENEDGDSNFDEIGDINDFLATALTPGSDKQSDSIPGSEDPGVLPEDDEAQE